MKELEESLALKGTLPLLFEDYLEKIRIDSPEACDIQEIICRSYLDPNLSTNWKPVRVELVKNKHIDQEYEDKKQDLLIRGRQPPELRENFGFVIENNVATLETISAVGLQTHESDYNPLGYSRVGVYLCMHADVCMQHALVKHSGTPVLRLILFKYIVGRVTTAIPRTATAQEFIEPTQGYDCHMSALPTNVNDPLQTQYDRSQVYCYEISKLLQPSTRPRQVMPYAVVTFTEAGVYLPIVDAKPTPREKLQGNPRLQEIIKAINSKAAIEANDAVSAKTGQGLLQGPSVPGVPGIAGMPGVPGLPVGAPATAAAARSTSVGNQILSSPAMAAAATGMPLTLNGGTKLMNGHLGCLSTAPSVAVPGQTNGNLQLKMIVNRINARLESEGKNKPSPSSSPATGDGLLGNPPVVASNGSYVSNGSIGSGSPIGSRPGSAEGLIPGMQAVAPKQPSLIPPSMLNQRISMVTADTMKAPTVSIPSVYPTYSPTLGISAHTAPVLQRKDPYTLDYSHMTVGSHLSAGSALSVYPTTFAGQGVYTDSRLQPSNMAALQAATNPYTGATYQTFGALPATTYTTLATTPVTYRPVPSIKRAFPDPNVALAEWDKRPKYF